MNQISHETGISKGKVHYSITDWKKKISDIDEIRCFTVLVKKSNISIEQCAQGFRLVNILKNLGIDDDNNNSVYAEDNDKKNNNNNQYNEFLTFIKEIYLQCKNLGIAPSNIFSWIKDLLDFHSTNLSKSDENISTTLIENNENDNSLDKKSPFNFIGPGSSQEDGEPLYNSDPKDKHNSNPNSKDDPPKGIVMPRISQISYYISQKKIRTWKNIRIY